MKKNRLFCSRDLLRALLLTMVITGLLASAHYSGLTEYLDLDKLPLLQEKIAGLPWLVNRFCFVIVGALVIVCGLGRSLLSLAGGLFYGTVEGTTFSVLAALSGSLLIFAFVRRLGRPRFLAKVSGHLEKADKLVTDNGFLAVILIRQLPLACILINILLALTRVTLTEFILGSIVGFLPEALVFALYGSSAHGGFFSKVTIASLLLVLVVVGIKFLLHKFNIADGSDDENQSEP